MRAACVLTAGSSFASTRDSVCFNSSREPSLRTVKSALSAFSCCDSWRPVRSATAACPRASARCSRIPSSAITAIVLSKTASMPDSNSSGTSTTAT